MEQINDLKEWLEEEIDLSDQINLDFKVTKLWNKKLEDFSKEKKNLSLRNKMILKIQKNKTKNFDALFSSFSENKIDLNTENKESFKEKFAIMKFKIKNIELPKIENILKKKKENLKKEEIIEKIIEKEEVKEETFVENFIQQNTKWDFQVFPLYKPKRKINFFKIIFIFAFIIFIWLLDKIIIENLVKTSYSNLILLKDDFWNLENLKNVVKSSNNRLFFANILFTPFKIIPGETILNVNHIIKWWQNLTNGMLNSIELYEKLDKKIKEKNWPTNLQITNFFSDFKSDYEKINNNLVKTYLEYSKIRDLWDKNLNEKINSVKEKLNFALIILDKINKNYDTMLSLLWEKEEKKYLVVFQNNDEIRATGGFIWSMAFLDIKKWKVEKIEKKDVYALEWIINQVYKDKEKAPEWLDQVTWTFWLRDSNYFPEFKDSSAKIKFFLDKVDIKIDWIIFINQNLVLDLIDSIWWVYSKTFWTKITSENFSLILSTLVEAEVFKQWTLWTPKQALFLFAEELYQSLNMEKKYYNYLKIIFNHIKTRDVVFYSFNPKENSFLWKLWLNWEINFKETMDFNFPVYTSIWWNKSDRFIDYRYEKTVEKIEKSCDFKVNLKIFNTHTYSSNNEENVKNILSKYDNIWKKIDDLINIQWKWWNRSFLRVLVPKEAEINIVQWQKIKQAERYNFIELYTLTKPGETTSYDINYVLKNRYCKNYSYKFFKQPWTWDYQILFDVLWKQTEYTNIRTDFIYKD